MRFSSRLHVAIALLSFLAAFASGCGGDNNTGAAESAAALAGAAGGPGFFDGADNTTVRFDSPSGVAVTATGDRFVADTNNHVIRKIDATTGAVTTFAGTFGAAGSANGTGSGARFNLPTGIVAVGVLLFVCDTGNHTIRQITAAGVVTTLAGTPGAAGSTDNTVGANARFNGPKGITSGGANTLFVADTGNHKVRRVTFSGATDTIAGSGTPGFADNTAGLSARFNAPEGIAFDTANIFVADTGNHTIRRITPAAPGGAVDTLAGDGVSGFLDNTSGPSARFSSPRSMILVGSDLYVADTGNHVIRKVDTTNLGFVTTLAGSPQVPGFADGTGSAASLSGPVGIGIQEGVTSLFFVADTGNHTIRQVSVGGVVAPVDGGGNPPQTGSTDATGTAARFRAPAGAAAVGDNVFVADTGNHTIRNVSSAGTVSLSAGLVQTPGFVDGTGAAARFGSPQGIAAVGTDLYIADTANHAIRKVTAGGVVSTFAGAPPPTAVAGFADGTGTAARFNNPRGIAANGTFLFVADTGNNRIRKIDIGTGAVTTLAGTGAAGFADSPAATFNLPEGIAVIGSNLFVADTGNHAVRRIANFNAVSPLVDTFAGAPPTTAASGFADGSGTAARFSSPRGIASVGSILFLADTGNHAVRRISATRSVTTFVGDPAAATTRNGDASQALLNAPVGITGIAGTLFFTDVNENVVRKVLF